MPIKACADKIKREIADFGCPPQFPEGPWVAPPTSEERRKKLKEDKAAEKAAEKAAPAPAAGGAPKQKGEPKPKEDKAAPKPKEDKPAEAAKKKEVGGDPTQYHGKKVPSHIRTSTYAHFIFESYSRQ